MAIPTVKPAFESAGTSLNSIAATMAITQAMSKIKGVFSDIINTIESGFKNLKGIVQETVAAFRPFEVELFTRAIKDLQAVFGSMFLPILRSATSAIREIANYFFSLNDTSKSLIASFAKITLIVGAITVALTTVGGAFTAIAAPIAMVAAGFAPLLIALSPIIVPLGIIVAAFSSLAVIFTAVNWSSIVDGIGSVISGLTAIGEFMLSALAPVWDMLKGSLSELYDAFVELFDALKPQIVTSLMWIAIQVVGAVKIMTSILSYFVSELARLVRIVAAITKSLTFGMLNIDLPESGPQKSAFGLGQHGGSVTDPVSAFKMMQEEILKNSGGDVKTKEDQALEANKKTAENTGKIVELMGGKDEGSSLDGSGWEGFRNEYGL